MGFCLERRERNKERKGEVLVCGGFSFFAFDCGWDFGSPFPLPFPLRCVCVCAYSAR